MATVQPSAFGELLKRFRVAAGLSQEALAEQARLSARAISDLERGARHVPRHNTIRLLAVALHLSAQERAALESAVERRRGSRLPPRPQGAAPSQPASAPRSPFVGRAREVALLERHLAGEGSAVLLLGGEPGIGKTRLLQEGVRRA